jgi:hypothetical protein
VEVRIWAWDRLALALGTAMAVELLLGRLVRGRWPALRYITGNSVAILSKPAPGILWPYWIGAAVAITSKCVLQYAAATSEPDQLLLLRAAADAPHSMSLSHQWGNDAITLHSRRHGRGPARRADAHQRDLCVSFIAGLRPRPADRPRRRATSGSAS